MANWTDISDAVLEPGKPIRSVDGIALRDNPIAMAEGAAGAPRIQTAAIANNAVTSAKLATTASEVAWVGSRTVSIGIGGVGSYALLGAAGSAAESSPGTTVPGSGWRYADAGTGRSSGAPSGTWRLMGYVGGGTGSGGVSLFLRIA